MTNFLDFDTSNIEIHALDNAWQITTYSDDFTQIVGYQIVSNQDLGERDKDLFKDQSNT